MTDRKEMAMNTIDALHDARKMITFLNDRNDALEEECERLAHQRDQARNDLAVARAEAAEAECERLRDWIVAACNANHALTPPAGIEIERMVKPWPGASWQRAVNTNQDAA